MANLIKLFLLRLWTPLFQDLPKEIMVQLDLRELRVPIGKIAQLRRSLEQELGHYVVVYKRNVFLKFLEPRKHLCANIKGAYLNKFGIKTLVRYERVVKDKKISFVVYQKPLMVTDPKTGSLAQSLCELLWHRDMIKL